MAQGLPLSMVSAKGGFSMGVSGSKKEFVKNNKGKDFKTQRLDAI